MSANDQVYEGSCLCGRVRYRTVGSWGLMAYCHCTDCRKSHGAAFATWVRIPLQRFTYLQGEECLQTYQAEPRQRRSFCRVCGSKITMWVNDEPDAVYVDAGTLDTPLNAKAQLHCFVRSKVLWYEIRDGLPEYAAYPDTETWRELTESRRER